MIKFNPAPLFQPRVENNFDPPISSLNPPPKEKCRPPTSFWTIRTLSKGRYKLYFSSRGGNLGETGGRSPQSLRWGDGPCIRPPNILRSSVVGCAGKYEELKRCFSCEERVILVRKGSCTKG